MNERGTGLVEAPKRARANERTDEAKDDRIGGERQLKAERHTRRRFPRGESPLQRKDEATATSTRSGRTHSRDGGRRGVCPQLGAGGRLWIFALWVEKARGQRRLLPVVFARPIPVSPPPSLRPRPPPRSGSPLSRPLFPAVALPQAIVDRRNGRGHRQAGGGEGRRAGTLKGGPEEADKQRGRQDAARQDFELATLGPRRLASLVLS